MTEETKELINCIRVNLRHNKCFGGIDEIECKLLLDYITNLQQENEELNRMCELYSKSLYNAELTDYKSRCEKANKIITDFMCTEEYCSVDPIAIAENYMEIQKALNGSDNND